METVRADVPDLVVSDVMMPRLDGLALVAALRADPRTAAVPVLLLSARAGQEASIEGLQAGADDYLVKPFAAAELLARVRANIELARLRNHHARWRTALVDSLQEAFFVCDEQGAVIEINAAFTDIMGYGADGLPYRPIHPWWPSADTDPDAHRQVEKAFARTAGARTHGTFTIPVNHRDGHRLWVTVNFNHVDDPDTGRRVMVGTFRDVTAEHYTVQRETALAALNQQLAQADTLDDAVCDAAEELRRLWRARRVLAVILAADGTEPVAPQLMCVGESAHWADLPSRTKQMIRSLGQGDLLMPDTAHAGVAGIAVQHPRGILVVHIELAEQRPFTPEDHTLLTVLAGRLGQGLQRVHQLDQQRETALALQSAILGPAVSSGFAVRYQPATRPLQVGGDWYDVVDLDDGRIALIVGDCVGHGLAAATVMGQLRSACRALLLEHPSPERRAGGAGPVRRSAARRASAPPPSAQCSLRTPVSWCTPAPGIRPPSWSQANGTTRLLDGARATPLGLSYDQSRPEAPRTSSRLGPPCCSTPTVWWSGVVKGWTPVSRAPPNLSRTTAPLHWTSWPTQVMSRLAPGDGYQDDVALLLYRQPAPLEVELPADASQLASPPVPRCAVGWPRRELMPTRR